MQILLDENVLWLKGHQGNLTLCQVSGLALSVRCLLEVLKLLGLEGIMVLNVHRNHMAY